MFRFRLGPIPISVHWDHLAFSAFIAYQSVDLHIGRAVRAGWPYESLGDRSAPDHAVTIAACIAVWMAVIFTSVVVHELGHALVSLAFGYRPTIVVAGMGGLTQPNAPGEIPWYKDIALTLAGPLFGALLGLACLAILSRLEGSGSHVLAYALGSAAGANLFWAVLNLVPVLPLDGGRISSALLTRIFGRRGFLIAQGFSLALCALVVVWAVRTNNLFAALFFIFFGAQAFSAIRAYQRGAVPGAPGAAGAGDNEQLTVDRAWQLYREGKLEEAKLLARDAAERAASPKGRARAHHLLGWLAIKEGQGRVALDHFSQAEGISVEPPALAAAFSLIGDDNRAVALWELAFRQQREPLLLHEWAGTLLRLGRESEAWALDGVDRAQARRCAERVLFLRGEFVRAAQMGEAVLLDSPDSGVAYDAACAWARAGQPEQAMRMLQRAYELGFRSAPTAAADPDLASLSGRSDFQRWLETCRQSLLS